jgi:hypothetical protein
MTVVALAIETEPLSDACAEFVVILARLALLKGSEIRNLESRIGALETSPGIAQMFPVVDGLIACPPAEWTEILKEARRLGVTTR